MQETNKSEVAALRKQLTKAAEKEKAPAAGVEDAALLQEAFQKIQTLEEAAQKATEQAEKVMRTQFVGACYII